MRTAGVTDMDLTITHSTFFNLSDIIGNPCGSQSVGVLCDLMAHREVEVGRKGVGDAGPLGAHTAGRHGHLRECACSLYVYRQL